MKTAHATDEPDRPPVPAAASVTSTDTGDLIVTPVLPHAVATVTNTTGSAEVVLTAGQFNELRGGR